jgi:hypothetical protein
MDAMGRLDASSAEAAVLQAVFAKRFSDHGANAQRFGLRSIDAEPFVGSIEAARKSVLAHCTNDRPGATFINPIGVVRNEKFEQFSESQRLAFFPERGSVMVFPSPGIRQPTRGQYGIWDVDEHDTDKLTRCHVVREDEYLVEVVHVSVHSSNIDGVREELLSLPAEARGIKGARRVYALLDGLIVSPHGLRQDVSRVETFHQPLDAWRSLAAISTGTRQFVVGPVPPPDSKYDCAPLEVTVKQLLKALRDDGRGLLTNAQMREVIAKFQGTELFVAQQRMARIVDVIEREEAGEAVVLDMLDYVLELPRFEERVNAAVRDRVERETAAKVAATAELGRIEEAKVVAERKLRELESKHKRRVLEVEEVVRSTFDRAIASGLESLTLSNIYSALATGGALKAPVPNAAPPGIDLARPSSVRIDVLPSMSEEEAIIQMRAIGMNRRFAVSILEASRVAVSSGLAVIVRGKFARTVAVCLARTYGIVGRVQIEIGISVRAAALSTLLGDASIQAIAVTNANLSEFSVYGEDLIDSLAIGVPVPKPVFACMSDSALALPMADEMGAVSLMLDLSWNAEFSSGAFFEGDIGHEFGEDHVFGNLVPRLSRELVQRMADLDKETRRGVLAVVAKSFGVDS